MDCIGPANRRFVDAEGGPLARLTPARSSRIDCNAETNLDSTRVLKFNFDRNCADINFQKKSAIVLNRGQPAVSG
jgi:hypothetical protein